MSKRKRTITDEDRLEAGVYTSASGDPVELNRDGSYPAGEVELSEEAQDTCGQIYDLLHKYQQLNQDRCGRHQEAKAALDEAERRKATEKQLMQEALSSGSTAEYRKRKEAYLNAVEDVETAEELLESTNTPVSDTEWLHDFRQLSDLESQLYQEAADAVRPYYQQMQRVSNLYLDRLNAAGRTASALNSAAPDNKSIASCGLITQIQADARRAAARDKYDLLHGIRATGVQTSISSPVIRPQA